MSRTYQQGALNPPQFLFLLKTHQKKHVEVVSIFHPSKLNWKCTLNWCRLFAHRNNIKTSKLGNSSIFMCQRYWCVDKISELIQYVESVGTTTKFVLVSAQNHYCVNVKFWSYFNVVKMTVTWHWNIVISSTLI